MSALPIEDLRLPVRGRDATVIPFPGGMVVVGVPARSGGAATTTRRGVAARTRADAGAGRPALRITRRGRLMLTSLVLAVALGVLATLAAGTALAGGGSAPEPTRSVVVMPGQTLHGVAATVPGGGDVRDVAAEIRELNGLESSALIAGQRLRVPVSSG